MAKRVKVIDGSSQPPAMSWTNAVDSKKSDYQPMTTNILIHIRNNMLKSLWNSKFSDTFHQPITDEGFEKAVANPVDLSQIRHKLESCQYSKSDECLNDIRSMFDDCRRYFKPGTPTYAAAVGLERLFLKKLVTLPQMMEKKMPPPASWKVQPSKMKSLSVSSSSEYSTSSAAINNASSIVPSTSQDVHATDSTLTDSAASDHLSASSCSSGYSSAAVSTTDVISTTSSTFGTSASSGAAVSSTAAIQPSTPMTDSMLTEFFDSIFNSKPSVATNNAVSGAVAVDCSSSDQLLAASSTVCNPSGSQGFAPVWTRNTVSTSWSAVGGALSGSGSTSADPQLKSSTAANTWSSFASSLNKHMPLVSISSVLFAPSSSLDTNSSVSADSSSDDAVVSQSWKCPICTYENRACISSCDLCSYTVSTNLTTSGGQTGGWLDSASCGDFKSEICQKNTESGCTLLDLTVEEDGWNCRRCTFLNHPALDTCECCLFGRSSESKMAEQQPWKELPAAWSVQKPGEVKITELMQSDPEFIEVEANIKRASCNMSVKIVSISRVENARIYRLYSIMRDNMNDANGPSVENERHLWHGTASETVNVISTRGFNRSYCGKNAVAYGRGVYFAKSFNYSSQDIYSPPDKNKNKHIFQCRVLTGHYCNGKPHLLEPPVKDKKTLTLYDSVVDNAKNPSIFVVFHDTQVYPEYLIVFQMA